MKYLKMAEGVSGLFNNKVEVLLESGEGLALGNFKVDENLIPDVLNKPMVIELGKNLWRITSAKIIREKSILRSRKVCLRVVGVDEYKDNGRFLAPTLAHPFPGRSGANTTPENQLFLTNEEWRQFEFLPSSMNTVIQEELSAVEKVLSPEISPDPLLGYMQVHYRATVGNKVLSVPMERFCSLVQQDVFGNVVLDQQYVDDSFVIKTNNNTYYGICEDGMIRELCLYDYESVDDEFMLITAAFGLVLADWCNATCIFIDTNAGEETPVSDNSDSMSII